jgi:hypothetical protein
MQEQNANRSGMNWAAQAPPAGDAIRHLLGSMRSA